MKFLILLLCSLGIEFAQEARPGFPIAGKVVDSLTGEALENVRVVITTPERRDRELGAVITKSDGSFQFLVERGSYHLVAERNGFGRQTYGARTLNDFFGVSIICNAETQNDNLMFRLYPPASISGQVIDQYGEPVSSALVQLIRQVVVEGKRRAVNRGYFYTTDKGNFRFGNLDAGSYFLVVGGTPWHSQDAYLGLKEVTAPSIAYIPVYYPNSSDPNSAVPMKILAGEEAQANFTMIEGEGTSIRVEVEGEIKPGARINLRSAGIEDVNRFQKVSTLYGTQHLFSAVPPGSYEVQVIGESKGQPVTNSVKVQTAGGTQTVKLRIGQQASVSGRVNCDGKPVAATNPIVMTLFRLSDRRGFSRRLQSDGSFEITGVPPGQYMVLFGRSNDCFPDRVMLDGKEVTDRTLNVGSDPMRGVVVESSSGLAQVKGFVRKSDQKMPGMLALLIPVKDTKDPSLNLSFMTDSDGSYNYRAVKPGEYWILATDDTELEFSNPKVMESYLKFAEKVLIAPRGKYEKDLEIRDK